MKTLVELYPIAIVPDRYGGVYSGGAWLAIANATKRSGEVRRIDFILDEDGLTPSGSDPLAMEYWSSPDEWIATGSSPDEALNNLLSGIKPRPFVRKK